MKIALEAHFQHLDGHPPDNLYKFVIGEVERSLLEVVMKNSGGNQSKAAQILGLNRATLRKKLKCHEID
ncbi:MAG: Fis family transcriptional regulator [Gammaproteobacteria bacterium]|nr:Fis family transcriptional regulator [Gammaproteobacteria bacterium]